MGAPFAVLLAAAAGGVWLGEAVGQDARLYAFLCAVCCALLVRSLLRARHLQHELLLARSVALRLASTAVAMGFAALAAQVPDPGRPEPATLELAHQGARFRARIVAPITRRCANGRCRLVTSLELFGVVHPETQHIERAKGRVRVGLIEIKAPPARGDIIEVMLRSRCEAPRSPWSPDKRALARRTGAYTQLVEATAPHATWSYASGVQASIDRRRLVLARRFDALLPPPEAGIVRALLLGDLGGLGVRQRQHWADAGLAHLLAISGLHVGLIFVLCERALLAVLSKILGRDKRWAHAIATLAGLALVWLYVLLAAVPTAALRAALMLVVGRVATFCERRGSGLQTLGLCGLMILMVWPLEAKGPSFTLSFLAVAGLLAAGSDGLTLAPLDAPHRQASGLGRIAQSLTDAMRMSLVATLATLPACIHFFGRISWVGPIANIVAVPLAASLATPLAMGLGIAVSIAPLAARTPCVASFASAVVEGVVKLLTVVLGHLLRFLDAWAQGCAKLFGGAWMLPPQSQLGEAGFVLVAAALMLWSATRLRARWAFATLLCGTTLIACGDLWDATLGAHPGVLQVYHLDVGQGDATLLRLPGGEDLLVDGGGALFGDAPDPGQWHVAPALVALGVRKLDGVLITHAHPDHIGGLAYVLARWPTKVLWRSVYAQTSHQVQALERAVVAQGGRVELPPEHLDVGEVSLRFVHADLDVEASANDHSTVVEVTFGARRLTLLADVEKKAEGALVETLRPTEIIKIGHHGSRTSSHDALLDHLRAQMGVISCGANNTFGFPHPESIARLMAHGIALLRTDKLGTIGYATDGGPWQLIAAEGRWLTRPLAAYAREKMP